MTRSSWLERILTVFNRAQAAAKPPATPRQRPVPQTRRRERPTKQAVVVDRPRQPVSYKTIGLEYCDANDVVTRRVVTVSRIFQNDGGDARIVAFCHLRQAERSFYLSRIVGAFDPETGEVLVSFDLTDERWGSARSCSQS